MQDLLDDPIADLAVPVDTVRALIDLARDLQGKSASTLFDDEEPDPDEVELNALEDRGLDPAELEFQTLVEDLPHDGQSDLVALMWLGRGDGAWRELRDMANERRERPAFSYLLGTPLVAEYLAAGLSALETEANSVEGFPV